MDELSFEDLDHYLLSRDSKIIHQVWFGIIPNRKEAQKALEGLKKYKDSWITKNSSWTYMCWNLDRCRELMRHCYPQHIELYDNYPYHIQRCDAVRYFMLHRYGGLYADMDYFCNRSWDEVLQRYPKDIYLVETPNKMYNNVHISNSLMYSKAGHVFWSKIFIELELSKSSPIYYSRHVAIMFSTGPGILNRVFNRYQTRYKLNYYPFALFHPYGLTSDIITLNCDPEIYAVHLGKGSWEKSDSSIIIFIYQEYRVLLVTIMILIIPSLVYYFIRRKTTQNSIK
jgi:mannosyltransferase OCH1-like enzyme